MPETMRVFDRALVRRHRDRAAADLEQHDFLFTEVAERLADRLDDVKRRFPLALDLGCHGGELARILRGRGGIQSLVQTELSGAMAGLTKDLRVVADEEYLPFAPACFDLVMSALTLHWVNDLPGALVQINRVLKPDGLFLAAMLGGETLRELRESLMKAELEHEGGASPRISPFADVPDAGALLQRAGFALPVVDCDTITVTYETPFALMAELRGMGETNASSARRRNFTRRATMMAAAAAYRESYGDERGRVPATFQVLYLTAWRPHESQQKPARRGSGRVGLAQVLASKDRTS